MLTWIHGKFFVQNPIPYMIILSIFKYFNLDTLYTSHVGIYTFCDVLMKQIQTEPVQQRFVWLNITEAYSMIPGGPDLHVKQGSSLRLECQLMAAAESPSYIFWYRENRMINYDNEPGVRVERTRNGSVLIVEKVKLSHGANYTCSPSNVKPAYIMIHVIEGERLTDAHLAYSSFINSPLIAGPRTTSSHARSIYRTVRYIRDSNITKLLEHYQAGIKGLSCSSKKIENKIKANVPGSNQINFIVKVN